MLFKLRPCVECIIALLTWIGVSGTAEMLSEPPFPRLQASERINRIQVTSEIFDSRNGHSTHEDFVDFSIGRGAFIENRANSHRTILTDAKSRTTHVYWPYSCRGKLFPGLPEGLRDKQEHLARLSTTDEAGDAHDWYVFGVLSIWEDASWRPKIYERLDDDRKAKTRHKWTTHAKSEGQSTIELYFHERPGLADDGEPRKQEDLILKCVVLRSPATGRVTTINVHSIRYEFPEEVYERQLQLPLMFGCKSLARADTKTSTMLAQLERSVGRLHLKMEVTATKFDDLNRRGRRISDTLNVEFLKTPERSASVGEFWSTKAADLRMIHLTSSKLDLKTVLDRALNVKYQLNLRTGTCEMSHLESGRQVIESSGQATRDDEDEDSGRDKIEPRAQLVAKFSNGLECEFSDRMMDFLFYNLSNFELTRLSKDKKTGVELAYLTGSQWSLPNRPNQLVRLVRKYSFWPNHRVALESATLWILDHNDDEDNASSHLRETYHFNVLDSSANLSPSYEAQLFDVSHECYLDNDQVARYGRDYVWLNLHYTLPTDSADDDSSSRFTSTALRQEFYHSLRRETNITHFRIPKMEFLFAPDALGTFTMRLLMLDSPALHLIYDRIENFFIEPTEREFVEVASNLEQCSDLCRLHRCEAMSFCQFSCVLTRDPQGLGAKLRDSPSDSDAGCTTFRKPKTFDEAEYYDSKLASVLARLQHHSAELLVGLPSRPNELDESAGWKVRKDYMNSVREFLARLGLSGFSLVSYFRGSTLVLIPSSVEIEPDPSGRQKVADNSILVKDHQVADYHKGLHKHRYMYKAFEQVESSGNSVAGRKEARRFSGIDFGQCALACTDNKCSSFSHCRQRKECIITDIYELETARGKYIQADPDCVLVQRDFLSKFNKFSQANPSKQASEPASNPSECAHTCMIKSDPDCLAFTFCKTSQGATCAYADNRHLFAPSQTRAQKGDDSSVQCDHYTRSYLADFSRLESRQIHEDALRRELFSSSRVEGQNVDSCAEICSTELLDCSGFQFCYDPESQQRQECVMITGTADGKPSIDDQKANELFVYNQSCSVFSLRKGSREVQIRHLAQFESSGESGTEDAAQQPSSVGQGSIARTLGGLLLLFLFSTLVFSALGLGFKLALRKSPELRTRVDRLRAFIGRY